MSPTDLILWAFLEMVYLRLPEIIMKNHVKKCLSLDFLNHFFVYRFQGRLNNLDRCLSIRRYLVDIWTESPTKQAYFLSLYF